MALRFVCLFSLQSVESKLRVDDDSPKYDLTEPCRSMLQSVPNGTSALCLLHLYRVDEVEQEETHNQGFL